MTQDNSTDTTISDASRTSAADGDAAVASLTLAELNTYLGKDFKDTDTALKALKDTQSFVGKRKEDIASEVRAELEKSTTAGNSAASALEATVNQLRDELFYTQNPQYKDFTDTIKAMGGNPAEVVQTDAFKKVFTKVQEANEVTNSRSVVSSNARLSQAKSATDNAITIANARGSSTEDVAASMVDEIKEQFGMK